MSATNHTTNYNLPQFIGTDIPSWLSDVNGAMAAIDTAIKAAKDAGDQGQTTAAAVAADLAAANLNISSLQGSVATNTSDIATNTSDIAANTTKIGSGTLNTDATTLIGAINETNVIAKTVSLESWHNMFSYKVDDTYAYIYLNGLYMTAPKIDGTPTTLSNLVGQQIQILAVYGSGSAQTSSITTARQYSFGIELTIPRGTLLNYGFVILRGTLAV